VKERILWEITELKQRLPRIGYIFQNEKGNVNLSFCSSQLFECKVLWDHMSFVEDTPLHRKVVRGASRLVTRIKESTVIVSIMGDNLLCQNWHSKPLCYTKVKAQLKGMKQDFMFLLSLPVILVLLTLVCLIDNMNCCIWDRSLSLIQW